MKLVAAVSALYFALLVIARTLLPSQFSLPVYFLAVPLVLVVLILVSDLSSRATIPTEVASGRVRERRLARPVEQFTRQIEVGTKSSRSYYETVVLAKLRDILAEKVSLETGIERKLVQDTLADKKRGPGLLGNLELYRLLYSGAPGPGSGRVKLLHQAAGMVEAWKP